MTHTRLLAVVLAALVATTSFVAVDAAHGKTGGGTPDENFGDAWAAACTAANTKCMRVLVCDSFAASADFWQMVAAAYAPVGILGKMVNNRALTGGCTGTFEICRPGTTVGPIKAIVSVIHVDGGPGTAYQLTVTCEDKFNVLINDAKTTLQKKTDND